MMMSEVLGEIGNVSVFGIEKMQLKHLYSFSCYSVQLRQMASRVKQAGPGYEEVAALLRQSAEKLVAARVVAARRLGQPEPQLN